MKKLALHWQILIAMLVGAAVGLILNLSISSYTANSPPGAFRQWTITDATERTVVEITEDNRTKRFIVNPKYVPGDVPDDHEILDDGTNVYYFVTHAQFAEAYPEAYQLFQRRGRSWARTWGDAAGALGDIFLRMLKMVAIPLIIASLISGVTGLGQAGRLGRMFGRTILYYLSTSFFAIITGLLLVNLIQPGRVGIQPAVPAEVPAQMEEQGKTLGEILWEQLENLIPENPFAAVAESNFLSIISFSLLFAVFAILVGGTTLATVRNLAEAAFEVMMKLTIAIIHLAPFGVLFMILSVTATQGAGVFVSLSWYMLTVALALALHAMVTLPLILKVLARRNPIEFVRAMSPALLTAFSSASSNGTLPLTMTCVEKRAGVSNRVSSFVLPLGATVNMDGTALYEVVAVLFIAQLTPGIDFTVAQQIIVVITALLASIGAAGIPHAGLVMMIIILQAVGLPTEKQAIIIAVDRVLDMCRTAVNVWSDSCGCAVVARFETARPLKPDEMPLPVGAGVEDQP